MTGQRQTAWAVEYVEKGKRIVSLDAARHSTPEEAKSAFEDSRGIPWKELERRGAKIVEQEIPAIPSVPPA
ncbi:MAG TPA: hypothetical protein VL221_13675 [Bacteroidota bacterium]|nr:hypothetical protein [Bacteroidota bacterium]